MISPAPYSIKQILHSTLLEERILDLLVDNAERRVSKNPTPSSLEGDEAGSFSIPSLLVILVVDDEMIEAKFLISSSSLRV